ncbi:hypothetical protein C8Q74DRAFT_1364660 [Fomes fomentarius]|nr:hypothetical protein C8Q74DRAFT_1364660 [Fomes fomentarius]
MPSPPPSHHPNPDTHNSVPHAVSLPPPPPATPPAPSHSVDANVNGNMHLPTQPTNGGPLSAALSTPHDAGLTSPDLHGTHAGISLPKKDASRLAPRLSVIPSVGSLQRTDRTATPSVGARSTTSTPGVSHEHLLDPFTGNLAGVMVPKKDIRDVAASPFDQRRDELWSGLATIRELQSEVASMHVQMEGIGLNDARGGKRVAGVASRVHTDTIPVAEEWEEPDGAADAVEEQRKRARDAEFTNLTETFKGRREAIDAIMNKLGELSDSLTTFHALHTPLMDLSTNRSQTKDSAPVSPDFINAASPSTAASTSPELPSALPKFVLSEPDKRVFHESPVSAPGELPHASPA